MGSRILIRLDVGLIGGCSLPRVALSNKKHRSGPCRPSRVAPCLGELRHKHGAGLLSRSELGFELDRGRARVWQVKPPRPIQTTIQSPRYATIPSQGTGSQPLPLATVATGGGSTFPAAEVANGTCGF